MIKQKTTYSRRDDMSTDKSLCVLMEGDGDIVLYIAKDGEAVVIDGADGASMEDFAQVEFCTVTRGGGRSPNVRKALFALIEAIEKDNRQNPLSQMVEEQAKGGEQ